jgi:hypothetical protein
MFRTRRCRASSCLPYPPSPSSLLCPTLVFDTSMHSLARFLLSYRSESFTVVVGPVLLRRTYLSNASRFELPVCVTDPLCISCFLTSWFSSAPPFSVSCSRCCFVSSFRGHWPKTWSRATTVRTSLVFFSFFSFFLFFLCGEDSSVVYSRKRKGELLSLVFTDMSIDWIKF